MSPADSVLMGEIGMKRECARKEDYTYPRKKGWNEGCNKTIDATQHRFYKPARGASKLLQIEGGRAMTGHSYRRLLLKT